MSQKTKVVIAAAAFVLLLAVAVGGYRLLSLKARPEGHLASAVPEESASAAPSSKVEAPDFTVQDADGKEVAFSGFRGKPVVLNFWASWCPPCKEEMPDYEKMYQQYGAKGVVFAMVNLTDGSRETTVTAQRFLKESRYTFPVYFDTKQSAADTYGISSIPDSVFIMQDGTIFKAYSGMIDADTMKANIEAILK